MSTSSTTEPLASLEFSSRLALVRPVVAFAHEMAQAADLGAERAARVQLAVEEVLTNIIRHGYAGRPDGQIVLQCRLDAMSLTLDFIERGLPFDFSAIPVYDPNADAWDPTGLGMHLVRQSVDEVSFENLGSGGKKVRLIVNLQSDATPFMEMPPWDAKLHEQQAEEELLDVQVRRMEPSDAVSLAQCAYRTWGYGYNDYIYHPEQVRAMLLDGRLESVVAVHDGHVIGHAALKKRAREDTVAEAGMAFVDPQVRSRSLMGRMVAELEQAAPRLGLEGIFAMQVTSHTISQRVGYGQGFRDCGLLLRAPSRPAEDAVAGSHAQRRSAVVLCYRPQGPQRQRCVFAPPSLRVWIARAYAELGLEVQWGDVAGAGASLPDESAHVRSSRTQALRTADIEVLQHGHDTVAAIDHARRMHHRVGVDAVFLHLDLEDPCTALLDESLVSLGMAFAGVLPGARAGRDVLILQSINLRAGELDAVQLLHPFPQDILEMVRHRLPQGSLS